MYIYGERERERDIHTCISTCIHIHTYIHLRIHTQRVCVACPGSVPSKLFMACNGQVTSDVVAARC